MASKSAEVGKRTKREEALQRIRRVRDALLSAQATIPGLVAELNELEAAASETQAAQRDPDAGQ